MNPILAYLSVGVILSTALAQPDPNARWLRGSAAPGLDASTAICNAPGNQLVVAGYAQVDATYNLTLTRFSSGGDTVRHQSYPLGAEAQPTGIIPLTQGGFAITGFVFDAAGSITRLLLMRTDDAGDTLWTRLIGDAGEQIGSAIRELDDHGYVVAGSIMNDNGDLDAYLLRCSALGDTLWTRSYGDAHHERIISIDRVADGGYLLSGSAYFENQNWNSLVLRTDANGNEAWRRVYVPGAVYSQGTGARTTADGGFLCVGPYYLAGSGRFGTYMVKLNGAGDQVWLRTRSVAPLDEVILGAAATTDGGMVVCGVIGDLDSAIYGAQVVRMDGEGVSLWDELYGSGTSAQAMAIIETPDHGYGIAGAWDLGFGNDFDAVVALTGPEGLLFRYPLGAEWLPLGDTLTISWNGVVYGGDVAVEFNRNYPAGAWESIASSTPNDGSLAWVPTGAETDHARLRIRHLTIPTLSDTTAQDLVLRTPRLQLDWPNGGEMIFTGQRLSVRFQRLLVPGTLRLFLNREYPHGEWDQVVATIQGDSTAFWITQAPEGGNCRLRLVSVNDTTIYDETDGEFVMRAPSLIVAAPSGGEQLPVGTPFTILWSAPEHEGNLRITLNRDYPGGTWETIANSVANGGSFVWTPTLPASEHCRIRVATFYDSQSRGESAADFAITTSSASEPAVLPTEFRLDPSYPNPFNNETTIRFALPQSAHVTLALYELSGRRIALLADEHFAPGIQRLTVRGDGLSSGLYLIRLQAGKFAATQKLILLK